MSVLDTNLEEIVDNVLREKRRDQIDDFLNNYMSSSFSEQVYADPAGYDCSSFVVAYVGSEEQKIGGYRIKAATRKIVKCCFPILDLESLMLFYDSNYHEHPFIIRNYDGEYLPDYINFISNTEPDYTTIDDRIYAVAYNRQIPIYIYNCPNLKLRPEDEFIKFITLD